MNRVKQAADDLLAALANVPGTRVYDDIGASIDPSALVLGPPSLEWMTHGADPTHATFTVYAVERSDARTLERLWELIPVVQAAIEDGVPNAVVQRADPGFYKSGTAELPAYELRVEVSI